MENGRKWDFAPENGLSTAPEADFGTENGFPTAPEVDFGAENGFPTTPEADFGAENRRLRKPISGPKSHFSSFSILLPILKVKSLFGLKYLFGG